MKSIKSCISSHRQQVRNSLIDVNDTSNNPLSMNLPNINIDEETSLDNFLELMRTYLNNY